MSLRRCSGGAGLMACACVPRPRPALSVVGGWVGRGLSGRAGWSLALACLPGGGAGWCLAPPSFGGLGGVAGLCAGFGAPPSPIIKILPPAGVALLWACAVGRVGGVCVRVALCPAPPWTRPMRGGGAGAVSWAVPVVPACVGWVCGVLSAPAPLRPFRPVGMPAHQVWRAVSRRAARSPGGGGLPGTLAYCGPWRPAPPFRAARWYTEGVEDGENERRTERPRREALPPARGLVPCATSFAIDP